MHTIPKQGTSDERPFSLMSLNIWGGRIRNALLAFIASRQDVAIFCLQEVYSKTYQHIPPDPHDPVCLDSFEQIAAILPNHQALFCPIVKGVYGLSIFVRKEYPILEQGRHWIYKNRHYSGNDPSHSRVMQWVKIFTGAQEIAIINVHGLWNGRGKTDSPQRILQSKTIKEFARSLHVPTILCGDFNLMPTTRSVEILAEGMQDLIKSYHVESTRSAIYKKPERFADYIFMPNELEVLAFKVLGDDVSDHLPLYVETKA